MYLYKQRYRKPCFNLLTDLKKQYRNAAIAKPIHFEPLMATPVIKDLHPGDHRKIKNLTFPEDKLVKEAYTAAKRYNPYYSYKTLERFADVQAEIMARDKVDREARGAVTCPPRLRSQEAYELASFEIARRNRLADIEQAYTLAEAERHYGMRAKSQSVFFSAASRGEDFNILKEKIFELANMRLNGMREDEIGKRVDELDLSKETVARLIQRHPELRTFFEEKTVAELLEPEPMFLSELIELAATVDPPAEEGAFPLSESDYATADVIRTEVELAESQKNASQKGDQKKKREKLTPKQQEQRRIEYQKMRAIKKQRK